METFNKAHTGNKRKGKEEFAAPERDKKHHETGGRGRERKEEPLTLHIKDSYFVRVRHRNVENHFIPSRQPLGAFGSQDHPRHVPQI